MTSVLLLSGLLAVLCAQAGAPAWPCPAEGDLDGDGVPEVLALTPGRAEVRSSGWTRALPYPAPAVRQACLGDVDGDGRPEVVLAVVRSAGPQGAYQPRLAVVRLTRGSSEARFLGTEGAGPLRRLGLADRDGDGRPEILALEETPTGLQASAYRWHGFGLTQLPEESAALRAESAPGEPVAAPGGGPTLAAPPATPAGPAVPAPSFERAPARLRAVRLRVDLGGAANARDAARLPLPARRHLARHGFAVVRPAEAPAEFHLVYLENQYRGIPTFVTADTVLHLVHLLFDRALQEAEVQVLGPVLWRLLDDLVATGRAWEAVAPPEGQRALDGVLLRLELARLLLDGEAARLSPARAARVRTVAAALESAAGAEPGLGLRTADFTLRGHYTRGPALGRYFRAVLALTQAGVSAPEEVALLAALVSSSPGAVASLQRLEGFFEAVAGPPAGESVLAVLAPAAEHLGARPAWSALAGLPRPAERPPVGLLVRRRAAEGGWLAAGADPVARPFPSALDWLSALGSRRARELLEPEVQRMPALAARLEATALELRARGLTGSLSDRWLLALRWLVLPFPAGYAAFQRSPPWAERGLVAAAASWAELRRDTVLYVEPPVVWMEGGEEERLPPSRAGFVEPLPELYAELGALLGAARQALLELGGPGVVEPGWEARLASPSRKLEEMGELVAFLERAARKELLGQGLGREEHERLHTIGGWLEGLLAGKGKLHLDPAPVASDVYYLGDPETGQRRPLIAATGPVDHLWVALPLGRRVVLARGAVSSYWEFPADAPLSDEAWRGMLEQGQAPPQPAWARPQATTPRKPGSTRPRARE
ncbi:MAG TPA: DUF3160 domain-containing protein [Myxococcota bacterium]|nr:DUF3160 domain-containing protein [Myxococcota bacterium]HRY95337.1 DUF3160 domain-containing protein [Myxococcota bacterium]